MSVGPMDNTSVTLIPDGLIMKQKVDMPIFKATHWTLERKYGKEGVQVTVTMKRKITSEMMTTYFPSLLLTAITFATTFFKPFFFEAALSVNLTTMLVMTTIFISKMEGLPPTSDIKMIDIWLVLCQMVPFVEVVLLTAMECQRDEGSDQTTSVEFFDAEEDVESKARFSWMVTFVSECSALLRTLGKGRTHMKKKTCSVHMGITQSSLTCTFGHIFCCF